MSRIARSRSESGLYHVMLRGANKKIIFADDEDCERFIDILRRTKETSEFRLYAYCLMGNHVHLLLQEGKEPLELIFKRLGVSYVAYYNRKYDMIGHLFQDRFRSEPIDDDVYFMDVLRYICQNPVKAGLSQKPTDYKWLRFSGFHKNMLEIDNLSELTILKEDELFEFISEPCTSEHLENIDGKRLTDQKAINKICEACRCDQVQQIDKMDPEQKAAAIKKAIAIGVSIRQLSRLTGISKGIIEKNLKV